MYDVCRRFTAMLIWALVFISCCSGTIFVHGPTSICFVWPKFYRRLFGIVTSMWQTVLVATIEKIFGVEMVFTGDGVEQEERTVMLLNHRTRLDWLFYLTYVFHSKILDRHKIALKAVLKFIPGFGWAMQANNYIFLDRNWEADQEHIRRILTYQTETGSKPNILFFPEGTDLTENTITRSNKFARKNNLQEYNHVLQPRTKGFCFFVNTLREVGGIDSIHDVTVGYPYNVMQGEMELLYGNLPKQVNFHFTKYSIKELPKDEAGMSKWIQDRWNEKEERLRNFYIEQNPSLRSFSSKSCTNIHQRSFLLWIAIVFWPSFLAFKVYLLYYLPFLRFLFLFLFLFYATCSYYGGVEKMEMFCYEKLHKPSHLWGRASVKGTRSAGDASNPRKKNR